MEVYDAERIAARMPTQPADIRAYLLAFYPDAEIPPMSHRADGHGTPAARIVHGCWIVSCDCRTPGVPSPGMVAWLADPLMWCIRCANAANGGRWRPYLVPDRGEREALESVLLLRDEPHRNWEPGESVADLLADNAAHDVGVI